jgi:nicotinamide riboside transporter PnuC
MAEPDELLTVAEIAAELKMNQQSIRNWIFRTASDVVP